MSELEAKFIQQIPPVAGYLVMCFALIFMIRELAHRFLDRLINAIDANTAARLKDAEEKGKLSEKIDALTKGATK